MKVPCGKNTENGNLIFVSEVSSGECRFPLVVCPECGKPLQAKKGKEKTHHFSHMPEPAKIKGHLGWKKKGAQCTAARETHIHKLAKTIISEYKQNRIPNIDFYDCLESIDGFHLLDRQLCQSGLYAVDRIINFDSIEEEERIYSGKNHYIADVLASIGPYARKLVIEIALSNDVGWDKREKIKQSNISAIEIKLNQEIIASFVSKQEWVNYIIDGADRYWLYNDKLERYRVEVLKIQLREFERIAGIRDNIKIV